MTWIGWLLLGDLVFSLATLAARNGKRKPYTTTELTVQSFMYLFYIGGIVLIGTGSL